MFKYLTFFLVLFFLLTLQLEAQFTCMPTPNYTDLPYWRADLVFIGTVKNVAVENDSSEPETVLVTDLPPKLKNITVEFKVEKTYRGKANEVIEINSTTVFKEGEKYFVYAFRGKDGKIYKLDDGVCGKPATALETAAEDIEYAEDIASGKSGTRVYGWVYEDKRHSFRTQRQSVPLPEINVTITNGKKSFTTRTDAKGNYIFKNIPTGEYKISAAIPQGMRERTMNFDSPRRESKPHTVFVGQGYERNNFISIGSTEKPKAFYYHSDSYNFILTSLSSIEGKVIASNGNISPQVFLWLFPLDETNNIHLNEPIQYLWNDSATGKFIFDGIPKGKYRIAINRYNCHTDRNPQLSRSFFPGVESEANSQVITVGENESLKLKDFQLLPSLKERTISGVVLSADKKILSGATVFIINGGNNSPSECVSTINEVKTDELGRFQLQVYDGYKYKIRAYTQPVEQSSSRLFSKILELPMKENQENIELVVDSSY